MGRPSGILGCGHLHVSVDFGKKVKIAWVLGRGGG